MKTTNGIFPSSSAFAAVTEGTVRDAQQRIEQQFSFVGYRIEMARRIDQLQEEKSRLPGSYC